jgi:hypothetical protein
MGRTALHGTSPGGSRSLAAELLQDEPRAGLCRLVEELGRAKPTIKLDVAEFVARSSLSEECTGQRALVFGTDLEEFRV